MPFDLLIKGGHVLSPGDGLDGACDIGIAPNWGPHPWGWLPESPD